MESPLREDASRASYGPGSPEFSPQGYPMHENERAYYYHQRHGGQGPHPYPYYQSPSMYSESAIKDSLVWFSSSLFNGEMVELLDTTLRRRLEWLFGQQAVKESFLYKDYTAAETAQVLVALPFVFLFFYFGLISNKDLTAPKYTKEGPPEIWLFSYFALIFFIAVVFDIISIMSSLSLERKVLSSALACVNGIAFLAYFSIITGLAPTMIDWGGNPLYPIRYLEWSFTCPILILLIARMTYAEVNVALVVLLDVATVSFGFFGALLQFPYNLLSTCLSFICFFMVISSLNSMFTEAMQPQKAAQHPEMMESGTYKSLNLYRVQTLLTWCLFPIVWALSFSGIFTQTAIELMFCLIDISAKILFTFTMVYQNMEKLQSLKVESMRIMQSQLEAQLQETDSLLGNMLPKHVLQQVKNGKKMSNREYGCVTVFFSDIANYTVMSASCTPTQMMDTLSKLWKEYDVIADKHAMFKVETIGDAYLGVTGCPEESRDHAYEAANFSLELLEMIESFRTSTNERIALRIGLHSGPVTAGLMGDVMRPKWCIVGDTVNTASRMESNSLPMRVHISESTFRLLVGRYRFEKRKPMQVKGKGLMQTYFLVDDKGCGDLSVDIVNWQQNDRIDDLMQSNASLYNSPQRSGSRTAERTVPEDNMQSLSSIYAASGGRSPSRSSNLDLDKGLKSTVRTNSPIPSSSPSRLPYQGIPRAQSLDTETVPQEGYGESETSPSPLKGTLRRRQKAESESTTPWR